MNKNSHFTVIANFGTLIDAQVAQSRLKSDGIESFILDENMVNIYWLSTAAIGGIRLQVKTTDAERAKSLLSEMPDLSTEAMDTIEAMPKPGVGPFATAWEGYKKLWLFFISMVLAFFFVFFAWFAPNMYEFSGHHILMVIWAGLIILSGLQISRWKCPRCKNPFSRKGFLSNSFAKKCMHCGLEKWDVGQEDPS